jgi:hypothetical protein
MKASIRSALVCALIAGSGFAARAQRAPDDGAHGQKPAKCEKVTLAAVYRGYGYDHEVTIENSCAKPIDCDVTTNSNPELTKIKVAAHATENVIMFHGSPAREFTADVACKQET